MTATADTIRRTHGYHPLRVKAVITETGDARSFVLDVPDHLFRYRAGQFCTFRVHIDGDEHLRSYSMSSAPEIDRDLIVTVKRVPGGLVSGWLIDHVCEGDTLEASKPMGVFCARDGEQPVVAYCGGSGVTPVMSITKAVLARTQRSVKLLYANRDAESVIFVDALRRLEKRHPERLHVRHHLDADSGFLDAAAVADFAADSLAGDFYICGPAPFMSLVESTLAASGVDPAHILIERFVPTGDALETGPGPDVRGGPDTITIVLKGRATEATYRAGDTVLETARRAGLQPPYSCEAGNCATCMARLREGEASMRVNDALTPEEVADGWILTCQAIPGGDRVTVEYDAV